MVFLQSVLRTWAASKPLLLYRAVRWECERELGWELTVSICSCCLTGVWSSYWTGSPCGTASLPSQRVLVYLLHSSGLDRWNVAQLMLHAEYSSPVPHISSRKAHWTPWSKTNCIYDPAYWFRKYWCQHVDCSLPLLPVLLGCQLRAQESCH